MFDSATLLDLHERGHRSLQKLIQHCAPFSPEELERELPGFGYASLRLQLDHVIGAEEYWIRVVQGTFREEDPEVEHGSVEALEAYRRQVANATDAYLRSASEAELSTAREMWTWPGKMRALVPAHVFIRTLTHIYHHQGQVMAMCRLLGRPGPPGLDFPLD
jgi:uncharacterized damage-inducible protein DinB